MTDEKKPPVAAIEPPATAQAIEQAIEAILFAAGYPMRYDKLAEVLGLTVKDVKTMVKQMATHFAEEDTHHGIQLLTYPTTCQLTTKEVYAPYIREALGIRRGGNLSASSMEVLAVVAYNQPVTRSFVELVRGVDSSYAVNSLLDKGLVEAAGRLDAPGRPMLYVTTDKFLRVFGINSLDELPETEALSVAAAQAEQAEQAEESRDGEESPEDFESSETKDYTAPVDSEENDVIFENGAIPAEAPISDTTDPASQKEV
ncbi:MAG: SMC-Scp complex subunit ScpB [Clostridia bacterium]|nr:SMC-Scp complex subunit ScpB [Clostridia bacterium]